MDLRETGHSSTHRHPWETARLWMLRRLMSDHVTLEPTSTIVDIGCGDAFVLAALARDFPKTQCFGVDSALDASTIDERQRALPANVRLARHLRDLPVTPIKLLLLMDVLEHIEDDEEFLASLVRGPHINPSTRIIVSVPAYQALFSAHDVFLRHFRRYTRRQLAPRLQRAGLRITASGYFFFSLLAIRAMQVAAERLTGSPSHAARGLSGYWPGRAITTVLHAGLVADAWTMLWLSRVGITLPGLSTYAVCRVSV